MKATLAIVLAAAALSAQAADITFDYTTYGKTDYPTPVLESPVTTGDVTVKSVTLTDGVKESVSGYAASMLLPANNIGNGGTWTYTITFSLTESILTDSISLALFTVNGGTNGTHGARTPDITVALSGGTTEAPLTMTPITQSLSLISDADGSGAAVYNHNTWVFENNHNTQGDGSNGSGGIGTFDLGTQYELAANTDYTLTITAAKGSNSDAGYFLGIGGIKVSEAVASVPEPTTATLSLLALAGLAARRRHK